MIPYEEILQIRSEEREYSWTDRDVMLYALAVGFGHDPCDEQELPFVFEDNLQVVPSFITTGVWGSNPPVDRMGFNYLLVVHGEQGIVIHQPLPTATRVLASGRVTGIVDKGDKGTLVFMETDVTTIDTREKIATLTTTVFARGDGGFGGPSASRGEPHQMPPRPPDVTLELPTRADQALLYRLGGDRNPLHADPAVARRAGYDRPILHGLCTFGITCRAVLKAFADYQSQRLISHHLRFAAPVYPGETIITDLWQDEEVISFEARVKERNVTVIKHGKTILQRCTD